MDPKTLLFGFFFLLFPSMSYKGNLLKTYGISWLQIISDFRRSVKCSERTTQSYHCSTLVVYSFSGRVNLYEKKNVYLCSVLAWHDNEIGELLF